MQFRAILPRRDPIPKISLQSLSTALRQFSQDAKNHLKQYPPKPSRSRYKRTRNLGKGWDTIGPRQLGGNLVVSLVNHEDYWVWVQGSRRSRPGQKRIFQRYGWYSITQVNTQVWPKYRSRILSSLGIKSLSGKV